MRSAQAGRLPLHYAVEKGAPLDVVTLLFEAHREAVAVEDDARRTPQPCHTPPRRRWCGRTPGPASRSAVSAQGSPSAPVRSAQGGKLPLHYAADKGAPAEVVTLLLKANEKAVAVEDKARRTPQPCHTHAAVPRLVRPHARPGGI